MTRLLGSTEQPPPASTDTASKGFRGLTGSDVLLLAISLALIGSAGEFGALAYRRFGLDRPIYHSLDVLWAKPLANAALFVGIAVLLLVLRRFSGLATRHGHGVLILLALLGPLWAAYPGSKAALALLALGITMRLSGTFADLRVRRVAGRAAIVLAFTMVGAYVFLRGREPRASSAVAAAGSPNVLLIILDTVRAASMGLYGGPHDNTPGLAKLAQRGTVFETAIAPAPWTLPTHVSFFNGLWPHEHGADWRTPMDGSSTVLAEALGARGYHTGAFVGNLAYATKEFGLDRGFHVFREHDRSLFAVLRSATVPEMFLTSTRVRRITGFHDVAGRKRAPTISREFLDWQADLPAGPWFAFLNYFDAHEPYQPARPFAGRYSSGLPSRRFDLVRFWNLEGAIVDWSQLTSGEVGAEQAAYEETIGELDHHLDLLFAELQQRNQLANTLVIVTSDHGELFGEHGRYTHGNSLYWRAIHVPLIITMPGTVSGGTRLRDPVSLRDLPATIMAVVAPDEPPVFPGHSMLPSPAQMASPNWVLAEVSSDPWMGPNAPARQGGQRSIIGASWQYIRSGNGREELYLRSDQAATQVNVASLEQYRAVLDTARSALSLFPQVAERNR